MTVHAGQTTSDSVGRELLAGAQIFLDELLRLQHGEHLLVYMDQGQDRRVASAIRTEAARRGARTDFLTLTSTLSLPHQAELLAKRIQRGSFQAICELSEQHFYLTPAWKVARERGARIFSLSGLNAESFDRCVGQVNHDRVFAFGMALLRLLRHSGSFQIVTSNGTDIRMELGIGLRHRVSTRIHTRLKELTRGSLLLNPLHRFLAKFPRGPRAYLFSPAGVLDTDTRATFLGGQLAFRGVPETIEGTAVIDGYLWPPSEIGLLQEPIILTIKKGRITDITGCPVKSRILKARLEGQTLEVEHFCIGFNPRANLSGNLLEAERAFGCLTIGFGKQCFHTDGVMKNPSLFVDGHVVEDSGKFVATQLVGLEKQLIRNGRG